MTFKKNTLTIKYIHYLSLPFQKRMLSRTISYSRAHVIDVITHYKLIIDIMSKFHNSNITISELSLACRWNVLNFKECYLDSAEATFIVKIIFSIRFTNKKNTLFLLFICFDENL